MGFLTRDVFETLETYAEARATLSSKQLIGPIYFILGKIFSHSNPGMNLTKEYCPIHLEIF